MSEERGGPAAPSPHDVVEVIDRRTGYRVSAAVEDVSDGHCLLMFDHGTAVPQEATVHWDDGDSGWKASARLERVDEAGASFCIGAASDWEPAPVRRSLRTPVENSPMLVRIRESGALPKDRRVHAMCLDISDSGCRAGWPGPAPVVGDEVELTWEMGEWRQETRPDWIPARVARVISVPFGGSQVGLKFEITDSAQAAQVRAIAYTWAEENRRRLRGSSA